MFKTLWDALPFKMRFSTIGFIILKVINKILPANYFKANNTQNFQHYEISIFFQGYLQIPGNLSKEGFKKIIYDRKTYDWELFKNQLDDLIFNHNTRH
ncbi:hypothetical protein SAMN05216490_0709 [Mucilaginibacter mallensis]|uniref:Uncharacterized protein n=1 Tax=Mucilaginibacter mallensis TaxID=652787 RepID=A0A1H1Q7L7_MUCMA|nr:hypothetical protein SAMN05216490_0709 [Mucilaginibacter mallensis]